MFMVMYGIIRHVIKLWWHCFRCVCKSKESCEHVTCGPDQRLRVIEPATGYPGSCCDEVHCVNSKSFRFHQGCGVALSLSVYVWGPSFWSLSLPCSVFLSVSLHLLFLSPSPSLYLFSPSPLHNILLCLGPRSLSFSPPPLSPILSLCIFLSHVNEENNFCMSQSCQVEVVEFLESFPWSPEADAIRWGGSSTNFPWSPLARSKLFTPHSVIFVSRDTHFWQIRQKSGFLAEK